MRPGLSAASVALFWTAAFLVQTFNWGAGIEKAMVLLALLAALPLLLRRAAHGVPAAPSARRAAILSGLALFLLLLQLAYAAKEMRHPHLIDVATTTLAAGAALRAGENPYTLPLDAEAASHPATAAFAGYKYLPLMPVLYLPLGTAWGARGLVLTNLLLQLAALWLLLRLGGGWSSDQGRLAVVLYLGVPLVTQQLFAKGATDLAAVVPVLAALALGERRAGLAGLALGLAIAVKPLPGALFLPCLLPSQARARWRYAAGVAVGLLPILPFALGSPRALYANVILFNAVRPPDSTSWLAFAPADAAVVAHGLLAVLGIAVTVHVLRKTPPPVARAGLGALLTLAAILSGPSAHHNYQLWWLPFYCLVLARAVMARRDLPGNADALYVSRDRTGGTVAS